MTWHQAGHPDAWFDQLKLTLDDIKADIKARNEIRRWLRSAARGGGARSERKQPEP